MCVILCILSEPLNVKCLFSIRTKRKFNGSIDIEIRLITRLDQLYLLLFTFFFLYKKLHVIVQCLHVRQFMCAMCLLCSLIHTLRTNLCLNQLDLTEDSCKESNNTAVVCTDVG